MASVKKWLVKDREALQDFYDSFHSPFPEETKNKNNPKNPVDPVKKKLHESYCSKNGHVPDMLRFPVRIEDAGKWKESLKLSEKSGLGIMPTYPDSINGIPELKEALKGQSCPIAKKLAYQLVTFPIHPYIVPKDIKKITKLFLKEIRNGNN